MSYTGLNTPHSVGSIENEGLLLELDDGSHWQVYEGFTFRTQAWSVGDMINVKPGKNPDYPYTLVNFHKNEQADAIHLGEDKP